MIKWERDKQLHALAGAIISLAVTFAFLRRTDLPLLLCCFLGFVVAAAVGWGKEYLYDAKHPDTHTVDKNDFYATALGGVAGSVFMAVAGYFIQVGAWQ